MVTRVLCWAASAPLHRKSTAFRFTAAPRRRSASQTSSLGAFGPDASAVGEPLKRALRVLLALGQAASHASLAQLGHQRLGAQPRDASLHCTDRSVSEHRVSARSGPLLGHSRRPCCGLRP